MWLMSQEISKLKNTINILNLGASNFLVMDTNRVINLG